MSKQTNASLVPPDFPRRGESALSGMQPKLVGRLIGGKFVLGEAVEELIERYAACRDLAAQVTEIAKRKRLKYAGLTLREFLRRLRKGVLSKGWDLDTQELDWLMRQVAVGLGGGPGDVPGCEEVQLQVAPTVTAPPNLVPSVVDNALARTRRVAEPD